MKHFKIFGDADLFFVTLSFKDVVPDKFIVKRMDMRLKKPFIHLQKGVEGMKVYDEKGISFNNHIFRFFVYNKPLINKIKEYNEFKDYQLFYSKYQPKWGDLLRKEEKIESDNQIFWFITHRRYFVTNEMDTKFFVRYIKRVIQDKSLIKFLKDNDLKIKICTHLISEDIILNELSQYIDNDLITVCKQENTDIATEIAKSDLLITDFSSIVYDFAFLNKPSIIFQPDLEIFDENNDVYYTDEEFSDVIITPSDLVERIISKDYSIDPFFKKGFENIDYGFVKSDKHLKEFYDYFYRLQNNKITFIGYNFYGIGGTVNATMALAESLLEHDCLVELISLKRLDKFRHIPPYGLNIKYIQWDNSGSIKEKANRFTHRSPKHYSFLDYDYDKKNLHPYVGYTLDKLMKNIKTKTLVSTRESLHLFVNEATSGDVENKVFFFHTLADVVPNVFPNLIEKLKTIQLDKAVFITDKNRLALKEKFGYDNFNSYICLGNTLIESKMIDKSEIVPVEKKDKYTAIYLIRISTERKKDIENLINFAKYVKENNKTNIEIDVFGDGNYVGEFLKQIDSNDLEGIINYKFSTETPIEEIRNHDFMIDFTLNHSFGMTYIEAILNGKKVFCMENPGSLEVMDDIPDSYIQSYEWLCNQIDEIDKITKQDLICYYDNIQEKYSHATLANKFLEFIGEES